MSMFYELMMRKKEETLYPVIKGSLTDTDGIISGFVDTGTNYLQINNINSLALADSWEIVIKISGEKNKEYILGTNLQRIMTISIGTGKIYLSSDGVNWDIASGVGSGFAPHNSYVRLRFTGVQYTYDYSLDNVTWINLATVTSSTKITSSLTYLKIGAWWSSQTSNFTGSIDLNNSYIKINSTKYNLQAVVGYTVVGSPTIVDGVVSGFSSSDYLKVISKSANSHEINITLTTPSSLSNNTECIYRQSTNFLYINGSTHKLGFQYTKNGGGNSWLNGQTVLLPNTTYYIKVIYVALDKIQIYMSTDGTNYNLEVQSSNLIPSLVISDFIIGYANSTIVALTSSVDLNNTYIKINNKLWFNGQEA